MAEEENLENLLIEVLRNLIRIGIVEDRDMDKRLVRVRFKDDDMTSGWLPVLINRDRIGIDVEEWDETQWTEFDTEDKIPQSGETRYVPHKHKLVIKPYMPKINDQVLAVYLPVFNADGFVIGGIKSWR